MTILFALLITLGIIGIMIGFIFFLAAEKLKPYNHIIAVIILFIIIFYEIYYGLTLK